MHAHMHMVYTCVYYTYCICTHQDLTRIAAYLGSYVSMTCPKKSGHSCKNHRRFARDLHWGFRGASSNCIQPHLRDVAEALQGVKVRNWSWVEQQMPRQRIMNRCMLFMSIYLSICTAVSLRCIMYANKNSRLYILYCVCVVLLLSAYLSINLFLYIIYIYIYMCVCIFLFVAGTLSSHIVRPSKLNLLCLPWRLA